MKVFGAVTQVNPLASLVYQGYDMIYLSSIICTKYYAFTCLWIMRLFGCSGEAGVFGLKNPPRGFNTGYRGVYTGYKIQEYRIQEEPCKLLNYIDLQRFWTYFVKLSYAYVS